MGYKWNHTCSLTWMKARQKYLTASDVKDLLPFTATGRPRKITDEHYLKVLARKKVRLTTDDCVSSGAAARGHILEPYAVRKINDKTGKKTYYHWDDVLLFKDSKYGLAFSPDATNVETPIDFVTPSSSIEWLKSIAEVKCYSPERHLLAGFTYPMNLEERWQLAVAMAVDKRIEDARLLFYNPSMDDDQMFTCVFSRSDLEDEIEAVLDVEIAWLDFIRRHKLPHLYAIPGSSFDEERLIRLIEEKDRKNPV